jgi:Fe-S-cluster-containing hydrogenase component 2
MTKGGQDLILHCDFEKCTGYGICEYACNFGREGVFNPLRDRIQVVRTGLYTNMAIVCRKCEDLPASKHVPKML